jgi:hypothetical protein
MRGFCTTSFVRLHHEEHREAIKSRDGVLVIDRGLLVFYMVFGTCARGRVLPIYEE